MAKPLSRPLVLAIDYDMVIHDMKGLRAPGKRMGPPIDGAKEAVTQLYLEGYTIIIHTLWATSTQGTKAVEDWLNYFEIPYNEVTATKPKANLYIDDKGLRFTSWEQALQDIPKYI